jgi:hypothetical protein
VTTGEGIAIIEQGLTFGGGALQNFGINSNTSANGFIKCTYKKREVPGGSPAKSPPKKAAKDDSESSCAEDSERGEGGDEEEDKK